MDIASAKFGNYALSTSAIKGDATIGLLNAWGNGFVNASLNGNTLNLTCNDSAINAFKSAFSVNDRAIVSALESRFETLYTSGGTSDITSLTSALDSGIYGQFVLAPFVMFDSFKEQIKPTSFYANFYVNPLTNSHTNVSISRNSYANSYTQYRANRGYSGIEVSGFGNMLFGSGNLGSSIGFGRIGGLRIRGGFSALNHNLIATLSYAYASTQSNAAQSGTQNAKTNARSEVRASLFGVNVVDMMRFGRVEIGLRLYAMGGAFDSAFNASGVGALSLASNAKFGAYQIALDSSLGYRLKWRHSALKPYIGLNQYLNIQNAITDSELLQFKASSYLAYILDAVAGVRYDLYPNLDFNLFVDARYERTLADSHKDFTLYVADNPLHFASPYTHKIALNLGGSWHFTRNLSMQVSGFYKSALVGAHYIGGNLGLEYRF